MPPLTECDHVWTVYPALMICKYCGKGRGVETVVARLLSEEQLDEHG